MSDCDNVDATPLESLPGHKPSINQINTQNDVNIFIEKFTNKTDQINNFINNSTCLNSGKIFYFLLFLQLLQVVIFKIKQIVDPNLISPNLNNITNKDQSTETTQKMYLDQTKEKCTSGTVMEAEVNTEKCTAGTSTKELMNFCSAEVQTGPYDFLDSESDLANQPAQNLSVSTRMNYLYFI